MLVFFAMRGKPTECMAMEIIPMSVTSLIVTDQSPEMDFHAVGIFVITKGVSTIMMP